MTATVVSRLCAGAVAVMGLGLAGCARAAQDVEAVIQPFVQPVVVDGVKIGCELPFHIGRGPAPGDWQEAVGATVSWYAVQGRSGGALKIGYQPGSRTVVAPLAAFLGDAGVNNADEVLKQEPSESPGYIQVLFLPGERTVSAFRTLEQTGRMEIGIRKPDGEVMIWTLDLTGHPQVRAGWRAYMSTLPPLTALPASSGQG